LAQFACAESWNVTAGKIFKVKNIIGKLIVASLEQIDALSFPNATLPQNVKVEM